MQNFRGPQYKLVGDLCHVGGSLQRQGGIIGDGKRATLLATFPEECRPSGRVVWHRNVDNAATCRVDVTQEGVLTAVSGPNSNWVSLESATIIPDKVKGSGIFLHSRWQPYGKLFTEKQVLSRTRLTRIDALQAKAFRTRFTSSPATFVS